MSGPGELAWLEVEAISNGRLGTFNAACPICGPSRSTLQKQRALVLKVWRTEHGFATYNCAHCDAKGWTAPDAARDGSTVTRGVLWRTLHEAPAPDPAALEAARQERVKKIGWAEFTYLNAEPVEGTLAERYLASRGVAHGADLKFTPHAPWSYDAGRTGPGMVAAIRDNAGAIIGCQITHLTETGAKDGERLTFGAPGGGAVRLAAMLPDGHLAVAEGVETALSFTALYGLPCVAALSTSGLVALQLPPGLQRLTIAADNDASGDGLKAARRLAQRASAFCQVVIAAPQRVGEDWNDVLCPRRAAA